MFSSVEGVLTFFFSAVECDCSAQSRFACFLKHVKSKVPSSFARRVA